MIDTYSVPLKTLVDEFHLEIAYAASDYASIRITVEDVSRPGLQLAGFFDHYEPMRLQVMGNVEMSYVSKLTPANRSAIFDRLFSYKFPALLIARGIQPHPEMLEMAKKHNITILLSKDATSAVVSSIIAYLKTALAPRVPRHGSVGYLDMMPEGQKMVCVTDSNWDAYCEYQAYDHQAMDRSNEYMLEKVRKDMANYKTGPDGFSVQAFARYSNDPTTLYAADTLEELADIMGFILLYGKKNVSRYGFRHSVLEATRRPVCHVILQRCAGRDMLAEADELLTAVGFVQYLPRRWAKPGCEDKFWQGAAAGMDVLAFGLCACTKLDGIETTNTGDLSVYLAHSADYEQITVSTVPAEKNE